MDVKQIQHLSMLHGRFAQGTFDELDVKLLLLMLRDEPEPLREFGDFVAHRVRNKGPFHNRLATVRRLITAMRAGKNVEDEISPLIRDVYDTEQVCGAMNAAFAAQYLAA